MRALARVGRDVNAMEEGNQRTALHYAAGYGDCATARALVHSGAHVNARDRAGHDHARLHLTLTLTLTVTLNVTLTLTLTLTLALALTRHDGAGLGVPQGAGGGSSAAP